MVALFTNYGCFYPIATAINSPKFPLSLTSPFPLFPINIRISHIPWSKSRLSVSAYRGTDPGGERKLERERDSEMTITPAVRITDRKLIVKNRTILTNVPDNVIATSASTAGPVDGIFLGLAFNEETSRHVESLGKLCGVRFLALFRFKLWWMAQRMGSKGSEIPLETQFLLLESDGGDETNQESYVVFLPLIEGPFRACLQGNENDDVELCLESGDTETVSSVFTHSVYVGTGTDPYTTISDAILAVKFHLKNFRQRHEKKLPEIVDFFGWCTWDAFYQKVTQEGVESGIKSLAGGGAPVKFVIIDDGWQSISSDEGDGESEPLMRLTGIKENSKFQDVGDPTVGIKQIVDVAKEKYGLKYVYVWHAIIGYWGGVRPGDQYGSDLKYANISNGVMEHEPTWKTDPIALRGLGLVHPKGVYKFYNELHSYLASAGVDGVKVDVQCILETLGADVGGRVELTRLYHQALDASVARNFPDNGCIACMSQNTDALYCSKQTAIVRASDDFYPRDPTSHTIHIAAVAYNSVFLGEFMLPDWDMFHSLHPAAEYHASARAISGGPVYVSDAPGKHNFDVLKKLVLPDGTILRARLPGRPTKDCLFSDPARDGASLLKIWNMNKYTGVLGIYNCQGAAWNSIERKNTFHETNFNPITGFIRSHDVRLIADVAADPTWSGDCAIYYHHNSDLVILPHNAALPISLKVLEHEIFTVTPLKSFSPGFNFAPLGLIDMYNAGGAIAELEYESRGAKLSELENGYLGLELVGIVKMKVKGCGRFGAYSSAKPRKCTVGLTAVKFGYDSESGLVSLSLDKLPEEGEKFHIIEIEI